LQDINHQRENLKDMTKLKSGFLRNYNAFIAILLSLLGFSASCDSITRVEYGVPNADFIVKGTIESFDNTTPLPDIKVKMGYDSVYTDQDGRYEVENSAFPQDQSFILEVTDEDGVTNGEYTAVDTVVVFSDPQFSGGSGNWYEGKTEKEVNVKLKPRP